MFVRKTEGETLPMIAWRVARCNPQNARHAADGAGDAGDAGDAGGTDIAARPGLAAVANWHDGMSDSVVRQGFCAPKRKDNRHLHLPERA